MQCLIGVNYKTGKTVYYDDSEWPPIGKLKVYNQNNDCLITLRRGGNDITDTIMRCYNRAGPKIQIGFTVGSKNWGIWNENTLSAIEAFLSNDFIYDAIYPSLIRINGASLPCVIEARWSIGIN